MSGLISIAELFARVIEPQLAQIGIVSIKGTVSGVRQHQSGWASVDVAEIDSSGVSGAKLAVALPPSLAQTVSGLEPGAEITVRGTLRTHPVFHSLQLLGNLVTVREQVGEAHAALLHHLQALTKRGEHRRNKDLTVPVELTLFDGHGVTGFQAASLD